MNINKLLVENYRNIENASISFSPGINLLVGNNAEGKTNALEAIYSFARGKSFRGASDGEIKKIGSDGFYTELEFTDFERTQTLSYRYHKGYRRRERNGAQIEKLSDMIGLFRAVLFFPEHLQLVKGGPAERRQFIDIAISQCRPAYIGHLSRYKNILEQRNALLRDALKLGAPDFSSIEVWSEAMANSAAEINIYRRDYISSLGEFSRDILNDISSGREKIRLEYERNCEGNSRGEIREAYKRLFTENINREIFAGTTLAGPHRDDVGIYINELDSRKFASQGQQRSIVLALKLGEGEMSREMTGEYPVFLFDDVLSELDEGRKKYITGTSGDRQIIITSCDVNEMYKEANVINVKGGTYVPAYR